MQHDEFIGRVQNRARLASHGEAAAATRATLETLGERLERGLAQHVSSQLPPEIGQHLPTCRPFERVSIREGVDRSKAIQHARAVLEVLKDTTPGGRMDPVPCGSGQHGSAGQGCAGQKADLLTGDVLLPVHEGSSDRPALLFEEGVLALLSASI